MKTLLILRHAKSSGHDASLPDHDRPLNGRGKDAALQMGRLLAEHDLVPDHILCSTAKRARKTAKRIISASGYDGELELRPDLYLAPPQHYIDAAAAQDAFVERLLVIGHNPGLEHLLAELTGAHEAFPTAALAQVELPIETWSEIYEVRGALHGMWRPRDLGAQES